MAACDDTPCAAMRHARGGHGVLTVVALRLRGQSAFAIIKCRAIFLRIRERPALLDKRNGMVYLRITCDAACIWRLRLG